MGIPACFLIVYRQEYILGQDDVVPSVMVCFSKRLCELFVVFVQIFVMSNDRELSELFLSESEQFVLLPFILFFPRADSCRLLDVQTACRSGSILTGCGKAGKEFFFIRSGKFYVPPTFYCQFHMVWRKISFFCRDTDEHVPA